MSIEYYSDYANLMEALHRSNVGELFDRIYYTYRRYLSEWRDCRIVSAKFRLDFIIYLTRAHLDLHGHKLDDAKYIKNAAINSGAIIDVDDDTLVSCSKFI